MVALAWRTPLAPGREPRGARRRPAVPWLLLLARWLLAAETAAAAAPRRRHSAVLSLLASPKCHKVGRIQLQRRQVLYSVELHLVSAGGSLAWRDGARVFVALRALTAALGHGGLLPFALHARLALCLWPTCGKLTAICTRASIRGRAPRGGGVLFAVMGRLPRSIRPGDVFYRFRAQIFGTYAAAYRPSGGRGARAVAVPGRRCEAIGEAIRGAPPRWGGGLSGRGPRGILAQLN